MKYCAFDLEIVKEIQQGEDWKSIRPLGISCAAFLTNLEDVPTKFFSGIPNEPEGRAMDKFECSLIVDYLAGALSLGYTPLTFNGLMFDFDVLAEESGMFEECKNLAMKSVDMMFHFFCVKGYMIGLNTVAKGLGLPGKTEGMSGALAPIMWSGNSEKLKELEVPFYDYTDLALREKVLEYVGQDARTTLEVAELAESKQGFHWTSKSGRPNTFNLSVPLQRWLTVEECMELPEPDQSWMSDPKKRSDFYSWMNK